MYIVGNTEDVFSFAAILLTVYNRLPILIPYSYVEEDVMWVVPEVDGQINFEIIT